MDIIANAMERGYATTHVLGNMPLMRVLYYEKIARMNYLSENKNELIVGVISGLIVSSLIWVVSLLSSLPPIQVPLWVVGAVLTLPIGTAIAKYRPKKMKDIVGKHFGVERVFVDGKRFANCTFDRSELVFTATNYTSMWNCDLTMSRVSYEGAAATTMTHLVAMYSDPGMRVVAEAAIEEIKSSPSEGDTPVFSR